MESISSYEHVNTLVDAEMETEFQWGKAKWKATSIGKKGKMSF